MSNKEVIAKLNKNRQTILLKDTKHKITILTTLRVAKEGSSEFKEKVAIIEQQGKYFFKEYSGDLPNNIVGGIQITKEQVTIIMSVIKDYNANKHTHINSYSWLVCGCFYKGLDLIKEGLLCT